MWYGPLERVLLLVSKVSVSSHGGANLKEQSSSHHGRLGNREREMQTLRSFSSVDPNVSYFYVIQDQKHLIEGRVYLGSWFQRDKSLMTESHGSKEQVWLWEQAADMIAHISNYKQNWI